ncbi:unknown protein [Seminavis robusta]|uniref:Uncharacterized protein n=1 Tax=Seminavis robusta TaxID=568900 RepID=A0A9N8DN07_9STRA|nr:unknown protein [Seminavis robusta]|eukprot:Sro226_g092131.1  (120) ;mRNA; f:81033-81392
MLHRIALEESAGDNGGYRGIKCRTYDRHFRRECERVNTTYDIRPRNRSKMFRVLLCIGCILYLLFEQWSVPLVLPGSPSEIVVSVTEQSMEYREWTAAESYGMHTSSGVSWKSLQPDGQ